MKIFELMSRAFYLGPALACGLLLVGCGFQQSQEDAEKVVSRHFQAISTNGYVSALDNYATQFLVKTPREEWIKTLQNVSNRLGHFQAYTVSRQQVRKDASTFGSGTTVSILVNSKYSKHSAKEQFTLVKPRGESDFRILGHQIHSEGLLKD